MTRYLLKIPGGGWVRLPGDGSARGVASPMSASHWYSREAMATALGELHPSAQLWCRSGRLYRLVLEPVDL